MFGAAFFGGLLLVPTYFQEIRGQSTLHAGLLVAPQGIGAMLTMPLAGALSDRIPVGRIVPVGLLVIIGSMFSLTQISSTTPYPQVIGILFVIGLGMGATMMRRSWPEQHRPPRTSRRTSMIWVVSQSYQLTNDPDHRLRRSLA